MDDNLTAFFDFYSHNLTEMRAHVAQLDGLIKGLERQTAAPGSQVYCDTVEQVSLCASRLEGCATAYLLVQQLPMQQGPESSTPLNPLEDRPF